MADRAADPTIWDDARVEALGGGLIAAASAAGIGVSLVSMEPPAPRVVYVSDKGVEIMGHPREVLLNRSAGGFLTPEEQKLHDPSGARVRADPRAQSYETVIVRADGRRVPVEVSFAPIRLDGLPGVIAFTRDISERRAAIDLPSSGVNSVRGSIASRLSTSG